LAGRSKGFIRGGIGILGGMQSLVKLKIVMFTLIVTAWLRKSVRKVWYDCFAIFCLQYATSRGNTLTGMHSLWGWG